MKTPFLLLRVLTICMLGYSIFAPVFASVAVAQAAEQAAETAAEETAALAATQDAPPDTDQDGIPDDATETQLADNCPQIANPEQGNTDGDGEGDACDLTPNGDSDGDGADDVLADNCVGTANDQTDTDGDGIGDACDSTPNGDADLDTIDNAVDNCRDAANTDQSDLDGDGIGDACDTTPNGDTDGDGRDNKSDNCADAANPDQSDRDGDGIGDACDPTPDGEPSPSPSPTPNPDTDGDTIDDTSDNCPGDANTDQLDTDGDGRGDACSTDDDGDGIDDADDNCPIDANSKQQDKDKDGEGDACARETAEPSFVIAAAGDGPNGGDISLNHRAAEPGTYNAATGAGATFANSVPSLQPFNVACGDRLVFFVQITVRSNADSGSSTVQIVSQYAQTTTSGGLVGILPGDIVSVTVSGGDGDSTVSHAVSTSGNLTVVTASITGVEAGETLLLQTIATISCRNTSAVGGTIQVNVASAAVTAPIPDTISVGNQTIPFSAQNVVQAFLTVDKNCPTVQSGPLGTALSYPVTISNTGNIALSLSAVDSRTGTFSPLLPASLGAGSTYTGNFQSTVTAADISAGHVNNTLTVTGGYTVNSVAHTVQAADTATCPFGGTAPNVQIAKTALSTTVPAGQPISYNITVSNIGSAAASGVAFTDNLPGGSGIDWSISGSPAGCSITGSPPNEVLGCTGISLPATTGTFSVTVTTSTTAASCGVYNNTATLTAGGTGSGNAPAVTVTCPNVQISKVATATTVDAGQPISYTIAVTNNGNGVASGVAFSDPLPGGTGLNWEISAPGLSGCTISGTPPTETLQCSGLTVPANGGSLSVTVSSPTTTASCGVYTNTATLTAGGTGSSSADPVTVRCAPGLTTLRSAATVAAGGTVTDTATLTPQGNLGAVTGTVAFFVCGPGATAPDCSTGGTPVGGAITVAGNSATSPGFTTTIPGTYCFRAEFTGTGNYLNTSHTDLTNECFTVTAPELTRTKTADAASVDAGSPIGFTITVTNGPTGTATGVSISDELPTGPGLNWSIVSDPVPAGCSIGGSPQTLTCTARNLTPNEVLSVHVTSPTTAASCGIYTNTATVNSTNAGNGATNEAQTTVRCAPGLTTLRSSATVASGESVTDTATLTQQSNLGPVTGTVAFFVCGPGTTAPDCSTGGTQVGGTITVAADNATSAPFSTTVPGTYCFRADFTGTGNYLNTSHTNLTTECFTVTAPELTRTKTADAATVNAGSPIGFTITVTNGPSGTATGVAISDTLPTGTGLNWSIANDPVPAGCSIGGDPQTLTCTPRDLAPNEALSVHVTSPTTLSSCGVYTNTATISSTNAGTAGAGPATITVRCAPGLTTLASFSSVNAGDEVTDTATVTERGNLGPVTGSVTFFVCGPGAADPVGATGCETGGSPVGGSVAVSDGSATSVPFSTTVPGTYCFRAEFTGTGNYLDVSHTNLTTECFTVAAPELVRTKTADAAVVDAGAQIGFTIMVVNNSGGTATGVTVNDPLPLAPGLDWSIANTPNLTGCVIQGTAPAQQTLECGPRSLSPAGGSLSVHVISPTTAASCGIYTNVAVVDSTNAGDGVTNEAQVTVRCAPGLNTQASATSVAAGEPVTDTAVFTQRGNLGSVTGSVEFFVCGPGAAAPVDAAGCSTGGTQVGGSVTVAGNSATSATFSTTVPGDYCFRAEFTGTGNYLDVNHTNFTSECFAVTAPELTRTKTADDTTVDASSPIGFTITVTNGPSGTATGVAISDTLPSGTGINWSIADEPVPSGCSIDGSPQVLTCAPRNLAPDEILSVHVTSETTLESCGVYTNIATISSTNAGTANTGPAMVTVRCAPDLTTLASSATVASGGSVTDTATFTPQGNLGGVTGTVEFFVCGPGTTAPDCTTGGSPVGGSVTVTANSAISAAFSTTVPGIYCFRAEFTGSGNYLDTSHTNLTTECFTVSAPELTRTKAADAAAVDAGSPIGFTVTVTNGPAGVATGVTINDPLPLAPGLNWSIAAPVPDGCTIQGDAPAQETLVCTSRDLAPGGVLSVHVTSPTTLASCGVYTNTATVASTNAGTADTNHAQTTVRCAPGLTTLRSAESIAAGGSVTDTATFTEQSNLGPVTGSVEFFVCGPGITAPECTTGGSPVGGSVAVSGNSATSASFSTTVPGLYCFRAEFTGSGTYLDVSHTNLTTECFTVTAPELTRAKTADAASVNAGSPIGFTISVTNGASGIATGVSINDPLPLAPGLNWSIANDPVPSGCSIQGDAPAQETLVCTPRDLAPDEVLSVHVTSSTTTASCGIYTNTATISSTNAGTGTAGPATVTVRCAPGLTTLRSAASIAAGGSVTDTATLTEQGNLGPVTGSVAFFVCGPDTTAPDCTTGGTPVGSSVTVSGNSATSASFSTTVPGTYCFRAEFTGTGNYLNVSHTNLTTECFTVTAPELTRSKTADTAAVNAGSPIGFTISVTNGPSGIATGVAISDVLPTGSGITWSIANDPVPAGCSIGGSPQTLTCTPRDLAPNEVLSVHVTSPTTTASCGVYLNTATISSTNAGTADAGPVMVTVRCAPGLATQASAASIAAGGSVTDTATFTPQGNLGGVTGSVAFFVCGPSTTAPDCTTGGTQVGGSVTVSSNSATSASFTTTVPGTYCFRAEFTGTGNYLNTSHTNLTTECFIVTAPELTRTKTADAETVNAGSQIGYTISAANGASGVATGVTITDVLPSGSGLNWSIAAPVPDGCSIQGDAPAQETLVCTARDLQPNQTLSVHITSPTTAASCGVYPNVATVASTNAGSGITTSATVTVRCAPGLATQASAASVASGQSVTDTATLTPQGNLGPVTGSVTFFVCGPAPTDPIGATGCETGGTQVGGVVPVAANAATSAAFSSTVPGDYCFRAEFTGTGNYLNTSHTNLTSECFTVTAPELTRDKTADAATVNAGSAIGFTITVTNGAAGIATGVSINDPLPLGDGLNWTIANDPVPSGCSIQGDAPAQQTLVCTPRNLNPSEVLSVHVTSPTTLASCGIYSNTATVASTNAGTGTTNEAQVTVRCAPGLTTLRSDATIASGGSVTDTATLTEQGNLGPVTGSVSFFVCGPGTTAPDCSTGGSPVGGAVTVAANSATSASFSTTVPGTYCFRAEFTGTGNYLNISHTNLTTECFVVTAPELTRAKSADAAAVNAGSPIGFTITVTNGASGIATGVSINDPLPLAPGLNWSIASDPVPAGCTIEGAAPAQETLVCTPRDLAPNATLIVHVTSPTTTASCGIYTNTATVASTNAGTDDTNEAQTTVRCAPGLTTLRSAESISAGGSVTDFATLTEQGNLGPVTGSVEFFVCGPSTTAPDCTTGGTAVGTSVTVVANTASSAAFSTTVPGTYCFRAEFTGTGNYLNTSHTNLTTECFVVTAPTLDGTKTADSAVVSAGEQIGFTLRVVNGASGIATGVEINDPLPDGPGIDWSIAASPAASSGCSITGDPPAETLVCTPRDLNPNGEIVVRVVSQTTPASCETYQNTMTVSSTNSAGFTRLSQVTVACPDMEIEKTATTPEIDSGGTAKYRIVVRNLGPGVATTVAVNDQLPSGLTWSYDGTPPAGCDPITAGGLLSCSFAQLPAGDDGVRTINVIATVPETFCGTLSNTATVSAQNEPAATTGLNSSTATIGVRCADVSVQKSGNGPLTPGGTATFTITVTNGGPGVATNVTLTDDLPAGVDWDDPVASAGSCSVTGDVGDQTLNCTFGDLANGAVRTIEVSGSVDELDCPSITNLATIASDNEPDTDAAEANNSDDATIDVVCTPDVTVEKSTATPTVNSGEEVRFTIVVRNVGNATATNVGLSDQLPAGLTWTENPNLDECAISAGGLLTCTFPSIPAQGSRTITVRATSAATDCPGIVNLLATVSAANEGAGATAPNTAGPVSITVNCPAVELEKSTPDDDINAGETIRFTITVTNNGPGVATNLVMTDTLPSGFNWQIEDGTGLFGDCGITGGVNLRCDTATLAAETSYSITVRSTTDTTDCGPHRNVASVAVANEAQTPEALADNSDDASVTIRCQETSIAKTADAANVTAGGQIGFEITVTNNGDAPATNVVISDTLPVKAGVVWSIADDSDAGCEIETGILTCEFGTLAANGGSKTAHIVSSTTFESCGRIDNTATVTSTLDRDLTNNSSSAFVTVDCAPVRPVIECTRWNADGTYTAFFGYQNDNAFVVQIPVGAANAFAPVPQDRGQVTSFQPGAQANVFAVTFSGGTLAWTLAYPTAALTATASTDPAQRCADLEVEKDAVTGTVSAGDPIGFTITVRNDGAQATVATLSDVLPAATGLNWTIQSQTSGAGCAISAAPQTLSCSATLAGGGSYSVTVVSPTTPQNCATYQNTATVSGAETPLDVILPDTDDASVKVDCPDIVVVKDAVAAAINAGETAAFTITVTNNGLGIARAVTLSDTLPAGIAWTDNSESCQIDGRALTCSFGDLIPTASASVTVSGLTDAGDCGSLPNTATASATNEPSTVLGNNSDDATIAVRCAGLTVTKTTSTPTISAGGVARYTIAVSNTGNAPATGVTVSDQLPGGIAWDIDPDVNGCAVSGTGLLSCSGLTIPAQGSITIALVATAIPGNCPGLTNEAVVVTANLEADTADNTAPPVTITVNCPDIEVVKVADEPITVSAGDPVGFTIAVKNIGLGTATGVTLTDTLPSNTGLSWSIDGTTGVGACEIENGELSCTLGDMASGAAFTVHITSPTTPSTCGAVVNTATAAALNEADAPNDGPALRLVADLANNSDSATMQVNCPNLVVEKTATAGATSVSAGASASFTILVRNTGTGRADGVVVTDTLPAGIAWTENSDNCTITGGILRCEFGSLDPGAERTVVVSGVTDAADCGPLTNTATVSGTNEPSGVLANNTSTATITVLCPDVEVEKTADADDVLGGNPIGFTITVRNTGQGQATAISLQDTLPAAAGLNWSIDPEETNAPDGACAIAAGVLTCTFATLAANASYTVHLVSPTVAGTTCGTLNNIATATVSNEPSATAENNTDRASVFVECPAIRIVKEATDGNGAILTTVTIGQTITYTYVVTNTGNVPLANVTSVDDNATPADPSDDVNLTGCAIATLAVGASITCTLTHVVTEADIVDADGSTIENLAISRATPVLGSAPPTVTDVTDDDQAEVVVTPDPEIDVTTNCIAAVYTDEVIPVTATVRNTGDVSIGDLTVIDSLAGTLTYGGGDTNGNDRLDVDETWTYTGSITAPSQVGTITRTVTATGADVLDTAVDDATAACTTTVNPRLGTVVVDKAGPDEDGTIVSLAGACFELQQAGVTVYAEKCADASGTITFTGVLIGDYDVVETVAPPGYGMLPPRQVTVVLDAVVEIRFVDPLAAIDVPVFKLDCLTDPGQVDPLKVAAGELPAGCQLAEGVEFDVSEGDAGHLGRYETDEHGAFTVSTHVFADLVIIEDVTTATDGYAPRQNPVTVMNVGVDFGGVVFVNLKKADPVPAPTEKPHPQTPPAAPPVTNLPDTGAGTPSGALDTNWLLFAVLAGIGGTLAGFVGRRSRLQSRGPGRSHREG